MDRDSRLQAGQKLRAMYRGLGMDRRQAAKFLQVTSRTLHNWESGRHAIPFAVYKLLRLLGHMELPGPSWAGWCFHSDRLWTPEGYALSGTDGAWWSLLVRRAHVGGEALRQLAITKRRAGEAPGMDATHGGATATRADAGPCGAAPAAAGLVTVSTTGPSVIQPLVNQPLARLDRIPVTSNSDVKLMSN